MKLQAFFKSMAAGDEVQINGKKAEEIPLTRCPIGRKRENIVLG